MTKYTGMNLPHWLPLVISKKNLYLQRKSINVLEISILDATIFNPTQKPGLSISTKTFAYLFLIACLNKKELNNIAPLT